MDAQKFIINMWQIINVSEIQEVSADFAENKITFNYRNGDYFILRNPNIDALEEMWCEIARKLGITRIDECEHDFMNPENEVIQSNGYRVCRKCGKLKGGFKDA